MERGLRRGYAQVMGEGFSIDDAGMKHCARCQRDTVHASGRCTRCMAADKAMPPAPAPMASTAMAMCRRCAQETVHRLVPGEPSVCQRCDLLDEQARRLNATAKKRSLPLYAQLAIVTVVLVGASGFFHFVHGQGHTTIILKADWTLDETFVDVDDYVGHSWLEIIGRGDAKTARALIREHIIEGPDD